MLRRTSGIINSPREEFIKILLFLELNILCFREMYRGGPPRGRGGWGPRGGGRGWGPRRGGRGGGGGWGPRRGGPMRGPGGRNRGPMAPPPSVFIQHIPFDFVICENSFPRYLLSPI